MHITPMPESHVSECAGDSDYHSIYQLIIKPTLNAISVLRFRTSESGTSGKKSGNSLMDGAGNEKLYEIMDSIQLDNSDVSRYACKYYASLRAPSLMTTGITIGS